jgi:5-methylcytosine-specific restriction endonuclease McrA
MPQADIPTFDSRSPTAPTDDAQLRRGTGEHELEGPSTGADGEAPIGQPAHLIPIFIAPSRWPKAYVTRQPSAVPPEVTSSVPDDAAGRPIRGGGPAGTSGGGLPLGAQNEDRSPAARAQASTERLGLEVKRLPPPERVVAPHAETRPGSESPPAARESETRACPVCSRPLLSPGLSRHQQCEGRVAAAPIPAQPAPAPGRSSTSVLRAVYRDLVKRVEGKEETQSNRRRRVLSNDPVRLADARRAVLLRCGGQCENPTCGGQPTDVTDAGDPILEVDHVERIAEGGRDHPVQMVALCPNCHAMKERGSNRSQLQRTLAAVANIAHTAWFGFGTSKND